MHPTGLPAGPAFEVKCGSKSHFFFPMTKREQAKWVNAMNHNIVLAQGGYSEKRKRDDDDAKEKRKNELIAEQQLEEKKKEQAAFLRRAVEMNLAPSKKDGMLILEQKGFFGKTWVERHCTLSESTFSCYKEMGDKKPAHVFKNIHENLKITMEGPAAKKHPPSLEAGQCMEFHNTDSGLKLYLYPPSSMQGRQWRAAIENNQRLYEAGYGDPIRMREAKKTKPVVELMDYVTDMDDVNEEIKKMKAAILKQKLYEAGVDLTGVRTKDDLVEKAKLCEAIVIPIMTQLLTVGDLVKILRGAKISKPAGASTKQDLLKLMEENCKVEL